MGLEILSLLAGVGAGYLVFSKKLHLSLKKRYRHFLPGDKIKLNNRALTGEVISISHANQFGRLLRVIMEDDPAVTTLYESQLQLIKPSLRGGVLRYLYLGLTERGYGIRYLHSCPQCLITLTSGRFCPGLFCPECGLRMRKRLVFPFTRAYKEAQPGVKDPCRKIIL